MWEQSAGQRRAAEEDHVDLERRLKQVELDIADLETQVERTNHRNSQERSDQATVHAQAERERARAHQDQTEALAKLDAELE